MAARLAAVPFASSPSGVVSAPPSRASAFSGVSHFKVTTVNTAIIVATP